MAEVVLKPGRERSVRLGHPWVFSGSIAELKGSPPPGDTVDVLSSTGEWLARGAYSPHSQIRVRLWTRKEDEPVDPALLDRRIAGALQAREQLRSRPDTDSYREVHGESDGLPGVIVDRYGEFRVIQLLSAGAERWRDALVEILARGGDCAGIVERSDADVRELEGLPPRSGRVWGRAPAERIDIRENGLSFGVDLLHGQKTGFYLDQRDNRLIARSLAAGREVLDCFTYTGGFTVAALAGGAAQTLSIDSAGGALQLARDNVAGNRLPGGRSEWVEGDAFTELRRLRDRARSFDMVVLDPPRFAAVAAAAPRAARAYKDINLLGFKLLRPGGLLLTFSCSGGVGAELFQKIVAGAALDAGVDARIVGWLGQPSDHPVALSFPEGRYLKGLICRVG